MASGRGLLQSRIGFGLWILLTAAAIVASQVISFADTAKPAMTAKAKRGEAIFQQNCISCHNKQPDDTTPFGPPNLHGIFTSKSMVKPPITPTQAAQIIKKGIAPMPSFSGILTDAQISDVIAYLKVQ